MLLIVSTTQAAFTPYVSTAPTYKSELFVNENIAQQFAGNLEGFIKLTPDEYQKAHWSKAFIERKDSTESCSSHGKKAT
jgi:hypothetical protein